MAESTAILKVGGQLYGGWQTLRVQRGLEQLAGGFELQVTERWAGQDVPRAIKPGMKCSLQLDGQTAITGYVDEVEANYDAQQHSIKVSGRDATGDLVDCYVDPKVSTYCNLNMAQIAERLCKPYGIGVIVNTSPGQPIPAFQLSGGASIFDTLEVFARNAAVLLTSDGLGNLVITGPGTQVSPTPLVLGKNILNASGQSSMHGRYSNYKVYGQVPPLSVSDPSSGVYFISEGTATDSSVPRFRLKVILLEDVFDTPQTVGRLGQERAIWQRNVDGSRSMEVTYTVSGFSHSQGLWEPNTRVSVTDPFLQLDGQQLISKVVHRLDENGARTEITVTGLHAYDPEQQPYFNPAMGTMAGLGS